MFPCAQPLLEELRDLTESVEGPVMQKAPHFAGVLGRNGLVLAVARRLCGNGPAAGGRGVRSGHAGIADSEHN
jgi:hypothetical protein